MERLNRRSTVSRVTLVTILVLLLPAALAGCFSRPVPDDGTPAPDGNGSLTGVDDPSDGDENDVPGGGDVDDELSPADIDDPGDDSDNPDALPCTICHTLAMGDRRPIVGETTAGVHTLTGAALTDSDCVVCHEMTQHQQGSVRLWLDPNAPDAVVALDGDPARVQAEADKLGEFCAACHAAANYAAHDGSSGWQPSCATCHDLHNPGSENRSLVRATIYNATLDEDRTVVFTSITGPGSFDDGDLAAADGVCQVCHTATAYHLHDGSGDPHQDGENCTACHVHAAGFSAPDAADLSCLECHSEVQGTRAAVVNADGSGGHHLQGGVLTSADCVTCHEMTQHQQGQVRLWTDPNSPSAVIVVTGDPNVDPAEAQKLTPFCSACHSGAGAPTAHTPDGSWHPACTQCHELHDPSNTNLSYVAGLIRNQTLGADRGVIFTARIGDGSFSDGAGANDGVCQVCHAATTYHRHDGAGSAHNEGSLCTTCHTHANGFLPSANAGSCIGCHSSAQGARPAVVNADGSGGHHLAGATLSDTDCTTCHDQSQHQQGTVRVWSDPNNPTSSIAVGGDSDQLVPFCSACHSGADHPTVHTTGQAWAPACTECHALHEPAGTNLSLVASTVRNETLGQDKPVVFTARTGTGSFDDGAGADDGICQVCHTATAYHLHDGTGTTHNDGTDCTACHTHAAGFIPSGETSCTGCHASTQGSRRAVVGEFALASHHVQGSVTDADCTVCHDMTQHQQGSVRLKNVDDPANPAAVVVLDGNPLTSPTEAAKLEPFCLDCHDGDGANGSAPFSDGTMPPTINETLWAAASHATGQTTCMGDGETFGCHSTGHGSLKTAMLAPWDGSQPGVPGDDLRQEEGFCYSCHDSDGPAPSDVQSMFALDSHHNVSSADQGDGSKIECTHCHNPHEASAAVPLRNPDTGSPWTGGGEGFCLTCHDGAPPADVSFPGASPGTGYDKSRFVGTTHATALGADSCSHCHELHGSPHLAMLKGRYVVADYNQYTTGDGDYAACWLCHVENAVIQQDNAFKGRHKKHVKDEDSPCIACHDVHAGFDPGEPGLIDLTYPVDRGYDAGFIDGRDGSTAFWLNDAATRGNCFFECHSERHNPEDYDRRVADTTDCSVCH